MPLMKDYFFVNSAVFSATQSQLTYRTQDHLRNEESNDKSNGLDSIQSLRDVNAIKVNDDKNVNYSNSVTVMFNDPKTDNQITLNLTKENFDKLKKHFQDKDFYQRNDGAIRLSGRAEAFVSGWFGDIAYQRNYASADRDSDGRINKAELNNLKIGMAVNFSFNNGYVFEKGTQMYASTTDVNTIDQANYSIEDALNLALEQDENFDGFIQKLGEFISKDELIAEIDQALLHIREQSGRAMVDTMQHFKQKLGIKKSDVERFFDEGLSATGISPEQLLQELKEKLMQQAKALEALKKLKGGNALSADERKALEAIGASAQQLDTKTIDNKTLDALQQGLRKNIQESISHATTPYDNRVFKSLDPLDKELISVIDNIKSEVDDNNVTLFETKA